MPLKYMTRLLWALALPLLAALVAFTAYRAWLVLPFPHQIEYGEGAVLAWINELGTGRLPYKPIAGLPWSFAVYTPAYLAASAALAPLFPGNPWAAGRLLSLVSAVTLALLLHGRAARGGAWAALLWLASPYLFRWATFLRPDLFALLWSALGIALVEQAVTRERPRWLVGAALAFVLAFWSKQSFFAAPLAAMLWLGMVRPRWLPWLVGPGVLGGALVALPLAALAGGALLADLIAANANPFSWEALARFQGSFFTLTPILIGLALWRVRASQDRLLAIYTLVALLVTISVGKAGAWENYFLEPLWGLCALAGGTLAEWQARGDRWRVAVPLALLLQALAFLPGFERHSPTAEQAWLAAQRAESATLQATLVHLPPESVVWSEQMGVLAEMKRPVWLHSFVYTQLARQGLWEEGPLVTRLAAGEGALLIQRHDALTDPLGRDRWSRAMLDASERGWALGERIGEWQQRPPRPFLAPDAPQPVGERLTLLNWQVSACATCFPLGPPVPLRAGETLQVALLWRAEAPLHHELSLSLQLFGPDGTRMAQQDGPLRGGTLVGTLPAGALLRDEHPLALPTTLPPGPYELRLFLYESDSQAPRGSLTLPAFKVRPPAPAGQAAIPRVIPFGTRLRLLGHDSLPATLAPGARVTFTGRWQAIEQSPIPLTTFLHLVGPDGTLAAQQDWQPPYDPPYWEPGETVEVPYTLTLPADLPPGDYELRLGWYDPATGERLPAQGEAAVDGALPLGQILVR